MRKLFQEDDVDSFLSSWMKIFTVSFLLLALLHCVERSPVTFFLLYTCVCVHSLIGVFGASRFADKEML